MIASIFGRFRPVLLTLTTLIVCRIGDDTHLVQNTLRGGKEFNWILTRKLSHEADLEIEESWFKDGDMDDVRRLIESCDPRIAAAVKKTPSCLDWKICYRDPIPTWVSRSHKVVLLGDSCHPHLPTSAQGASQATESAAVLAVCLKLAGKENVSLAVSVEVLVPTVLDTELTRVDKDL